MPITINLAENESHISQALRVRHTVFCEEEKLFPETPSKMMLDEYDAFPSSKIFVARHGDTVVGTVRVTLDNTQGLPADHYFDFREHCKDDSKVMSVSMFCVIKPYRRAALSTGLLLMCVYYAMGNDVDFIIAPLNPAIAKMIIRLGATSLTSEPIALVGSDLKVLPVVFDMKNLNELFLNFARNNMSYNMIRSFHCMYFDKGEKIITKGDTGDSAYVLIEGGAEVIDPNGTAGIALLDVGEVFGELALFSQGFVRTADVVATAKTRVMILPKAAFLEHIRNDPETSLKMLQTVSSRMQKMISKL